MYQTNYQKKRREALPEYISVISSSSCAKIRIDDIEIIEQDGRKLHVITAGRDYTFYGMLNTVAETLAERAFFRPIKSVIINLDHVKDISGYSVNFNSGQSLAMGKNALAVTKKAYKRYLQRYPPYTIWEPIITVGSRVADASDQLDSFGGAV
ncbi:MAG: LytTR family transcriptional regulator [Mogibacterium sp.]|nr:LytTR family transcriptional regulator [Mogibacterium sp.]